MRSLLPLLLLIALPAAAVEVRLQVEAPPELQATATRIAAYDPSRLARTAEVIGITEPIPPLRVVLAPEDSELGRATPSWVAGFAVPRPPVIVLFPGRTTSYPTDSLESLLHHEVAHLLIERAARGNRVPRWFHEGVALVAGRAWGLEDRTRFAVEMMAGRRVPIGRLDTMFRLGPPASTRAYAVSGAFVHELFARHGTGIAARILDQIGQGVAFEEAFQRATGVPLEQAEAEFWRRQTAWSRWVPLVSSGVVLWLLVTLLALWAVRRKRKRAAEIVASWGEEEEDEY